MPTFSQYDIIVVNLDPIMGSEIKKKRPCVIVSPNEMNKHLDTLVVCPVTSQSRNYPTRVRFDLDGQENWIVIDQIRAIDKSRVTKTIGFLAEVTIKQVKDIFKETYIDWVEDATHRTSFLKKDKKQAFDKAENETIEKIIKYTLLKKEEIEKL